MAIGDRQSAISLLTKEKRKEIIFTLSFPATRVKAGV
jgi:hypothetical protein